MLSLLKIGNDLSKFSNNLDSNFNNEFTYKLNDSCIITNEGLKTIRFNVIDEISKNEEAKKIIQDYINISDINYQIKEDDSYELIELHLRFLIIRQFEIWNKISLVSVSDDEELIKMKDKNYNIENDKINKFNELIEKFQMQRLHIDCSYWKQFLDTLLYKIHNSNNKEQVIREFSNFFKSLV